MYLHFGYQQISPSGLINLETLKYTVSAVSGPGVGIPAKKVSGRVRAGSMGLILGSGSGPGRVRVGSVVRKQGSPKLWGSTQGVPLTLMNKREKKKTN